MILPLVAYGVFVGLALAAMGAMLERVLALRRWPRRWAWAFALGASLFLTIDVPWRSHHPAPAAPDSGWIASTAGRMLGAGADRSAPARPRWLDRYSLKLDEVARVAAQLDPIAGWAWTLGSAAVAVSYGAGLWVLSRRRRSWVETHLHGMRVLVASQDGPAVLGVWKPRIVVPEWTLALEPRAVELMLNHEREHQRASDPLLLHAAAVGVFLMPWNPGAWWMLSRLKLATEMDCDARVLKREDAAGCRMRPPMASCC